MEKTCKKCDTTQPITEFRVYKAMKDRYTNECNSCRRLRENKAVREKKGCVDKLCPICDTVKPPIAFSIETNNDDQLAYVCVECAKDRNKVRKYRNRIQYKCSSCKETKSGFYFPVTIHSYTTIYSWCKECLSSHRKENGVYDDIVEKRKKVIKDAEFYKKQHEQEVKRHYKDVRIRMLSQCKKRATQKAIAFNLTREDLIIPKYCPILQVELKTGNRVSYGCSPSIDRIDNSRGYERDNIQIISMKANTMKSNATPEQLMMFAEWVIKTYNK